MKDDENLDFDIHYVQGNNEEYVVSICNIVNPDNFTTNKKEVTCVDCKNILYDSCNC